MVVAHGPELALRSDLPIFGGFCMRASRSSIRSLPSKGIDPVRLRIRFSKRGAAGSHGRSNAEVHGCRLRDILLNPNRI